MQNNIIQRVAEDQPQLKAIVRFHLRAAVP